MEKKSLIIINNEKVFEEDGQFYCDNFDMKATPEALNNYYLVSIPTAITQNALKKFIDNPPIAVAAQYTDANFYGTLDAKAFALF